MAASSFEFRYRFWFQGLIYWLGFSAYNFDHRQTAGWLAALLAGNVRSPSGYLEWRVLLAVAALVALAAAALRTWASAYLASEVVHDARVRVARLVADGPYRYTRNPLYLGGLLLAVAYGLLASRSGLVILVGGNLWFYFRLMAREEAALAASHGPAFDAFLAAVPRFWPRRRPTLPASGAQPHWRQAFVGETFFWVFAAGVVGYAVVPSFRAFYWVVGIGLLSYLALWPWWRQRSAAAKTSGDAV